MFNPIVKILGVIALVLATAVNAEEKDPFDITIYGSFLHTGTVPNALFFFNDIEQYDSFELRRAIRNHDIDIVVLASDGGSVWEGLNMAGIIHDKGIATYVPELPEKLGCYSACSFMFFGGKIRQADGILAVHQAGAYGSERDKANAKVSETQQNTQFTVSEIIGFLNEFETPPWVFEKMFRSREFHTFDETEKSRVARRTEELDPKKLYEINAFINSFLDHLESLNKNDTTQEEPTTEQDEEEEKRLAVMKVQKRLNDLGCNAGIADGVWGPRTMAAARLFAQTAGLPTEKTQLLSTEFLDALMSAKPKLCPKKTKASRVKTFAKYYQVYCGSRALNEFFTIRYANTKVREFQWRKVDSSRPFVVVRYNGNNWQDTASGVQGTLKFNTNGYVTSFSFSNRNCPNIKLKAR